MRPSRRTVLAGLSAAAATATAGCLGGGNGGSDEVPDDAVESLPTPVHGDEDAPVTVAVFEDFACPHCRTFAVDVHPRLVDEYVDPGDVRYEHHDFPIPVDDRWSWEAPGAARAVQDTVGDEAFFTFTQRLFEEGWTDGSPTYSESLLRDLAGAVDADPDTVVTAASEGRYRPVLEADREAGLDRGVQGTPSVFVDGTLIDRPDYATISSAIDDSR
ncbi:DsbA family protein [Halobaculum rubrum]|uniref:DsbA family protein n=1 Tax=Halobaculum rubrum TaxID=2872158 RepID=UPI001CA3EC93|nr:DsbA family protein [Halobaculum rubrum]